MNELIYATFAVLTGIILFQQWQIQKLLNKLMSRNFHEYQSAVQSKKNEPQKIVVNGDVPEDTGALREFGPNF